MKAEIISVGTELLLGQIANTDAQYISGELSRIGVGVYYHTVVGDNETRICEAIKAADARCDVVILTGGLGPTADDLTKETLCGYLGLACVMHRRSYERLCARFAQMNIKEPTENNFKQVYFPKDAVVLDNDNGTAPGMYYEREDGHVFMALPGPPFELNPMFSNYALPLLTKKSGCVLKSRVLRLCGIGESLIETKIKDILDAQTNPTIAPLLGNGDVTLRITAMAKSEEEAEKLILPAEKSLTERLGEYVYGYDDDTPEKVLVELLKQKKLKISTAESCTGGLIASRITDVSGASSVFDEGVVTYANEAKTKYLGVSEQTIEKYGAVSSQTAEEMVNGLLKNMNCDVAVAVTGIAGPTGGTKEKPVGLVYIAVGVKCGDGILTDVTKNNFAGSRDKIKFRTSTTAIINTIGMIKNCKIQERK